MIVAGRDGERLDAVKRDQPQLATVVIDVTDPYGVTTAATEVQTRFPDLNVLVAIPGIMFPEDLHTSAFLDVAERTVATNLLGTSRLVAAFTEFLAARPNAAILTVSSGLEFVPPLYTYLQRN